jgi:iron-sulfur cluster repair protein YtfE (RIC family)
MDDKISLQAIENYSEAYAGIVASDFYSKNQKINGPQILTLTEIKQVNLFVIRELMNEWQAEAQKIKSPYFDYEAEEVVSSLKAFHNTLSNHISIDKTVFVPLLKKAVYQTLFLLLSPYDFFSETLDTQGKSSLLVTDLKNHIKYVKINRAPLEKLLERLEERKVISVGGNETFSLLDTILEEVNFSPEEIDEYIAKFSAVFPLSIERLYEKKALANKPIVELKKKIEKPEVVQTALPLVKEVIESNSKVGRIKDKLSINQKFMFTKILFHGDFEIFSQALDRIDMLDNLTQVKLYLEKTYPEWDTESEEYAELINLVERKFMH